MIIEYANYVTLATSLSNPPRPPTRTPYSTPPSLATRTATSTCPSNQNNSLRTLPSSNSVFVKLPTNRLRVVRSDGMSPAPSSTCRIAPEILQSCHYSLKSDIYAFGSVLYEIFFQKLPYYERGTPQQVANDDQVFPLLALSLLVAQNALLGHHPPLHPYQHQHPSQYVPLSPLHR